MEDAISDPVETEFKSVTDDDGIASFDVTRVSISSDVDTFICGVKVDDFKLLSVRGDDSSFNDVSMFVDLSSDTGNVAVSKELDLIVDDFVSSWTVSFAISVDFITLELVVFSIVSSKVLSLVVDVPVTSTFVISDDFSPAIVVF